MTTVVIAPAEADAAGRVALTRALATFPSQVVVVAADQCVQALRDAAADAHVDWLIVIDADVLLDPDAFGPLRRVLEQRPALVGGRALVGTSQHLGAMFAPPRWGPAAVELAPIVVPVGQPVDVFAGLVDVPARGVFVVAAELVRDESVALSSPGLYLQLAARAKLAGRAVVCEPLLRFTAAGDPPQLERAKPRLVHDLPVELAHGSLHRDPLVVRERLISRELRVMGNVRGYERRPYPPTTALIVAAGRLARSTTSRLQADRIAQEVESIDPRGADALRAALSRTGDRYLLVADAFRLPDRAAFVSLVERLERSGTIALALDADAAPFGAALFHLGRVRGADALRGRTVWEVVEDAARRWPHERLLVSGPSGIVLSEALPPLPTPARIDAIMLASGRPELTKQTLEALRHNDVTGECFVVTAAGAETTAKLVASWPDIRVVLDPLDPHLSSGLRQALSRSRGDVVLVMRDDVQLPRGALARMADAFGRVPGLAMALPRGGIGDHPEAMPDVRYRDLPAMQAFADRRAEQHLREVTLVDSASLPIALIARRAFEVIGGFEPIAGFSRWGVADFARRLRAANWRVAVCDDAYVHLFSIEESRSLVQRNDGAAHVRAVYEARRTDHSGFDPERDVVPLGIDDERAEPAAIRLRVLVPLRDAEELQRAQPLLGAFVAAFGVEDPLEVAIGLDGELEVAAAVGAIRDLAARSGRALEATVNVRIELTPDLAAWRDAFPEVVRLASFDRAELAEVRAIAGADEAADLLRSTVS